MDRDVSTRLVAKLIAATQSEQLSWRKQTVRQIVSKDHATSAIYFCKLNDLSFRIYRYKWERGEYYGWKDVVLSKVEPLRSRGIVLEILDEDNDLIETIQDSSALWDLFDVVNRTVSKIQEKLERVLSYNVAE